MAAGPRVCDECAPEDGGNGTGDVLSLQERPLSVSRAVKSASTQSTTKNGEGRVSVMTADMLARF